MPRKKNQIKKINDSDLLKIHRRVFRNFLKHNLKVTNSTYVTLIHEYDRRLTKDNIRLMYPLHIGDFTEILLKAIDKDTA